MKNSKQVNPNTGKHSRGDGGFSAAAFQTLTSGLGSDSNAAAKPIADLFTGATVMFADIVHFTAWSSVREPPQVLLLLETIYSAFDRLARRNRGAYRFSIYVTILSYFF